MKKLIRIFLTCSLIFGALLSWEEYSQFLSLGHLAVSTGTPAAEQLFWNTLKPEELRYWPVFMYRCGRLKEKIESELPVSFSIQRKGTTGFLVNLEPLRPAFTVRWKERSFYITKRGRIWDTDHPSGEIISREDLPQAPPFVLADTLPPPMNISGDRYLVTDSVFPAALLSEWLAGLESNGWMGHTRLVKISKREGKFLLKLDMKVAKKAVSVLLWGERSGWEKIFSAVSQILNQLQLSGGDIIIDATYTDRIIVRNSPVGGQEGSGK